ncbi:MAG: DMT family transporter [Candidatus Izemoplasma sp.]|nr:DMT family transporter [Candidatus Izemoplasma sp.]
MTIIALPLIAGLAITLQSVLNNRFGREAGMLEVVIFVHFFGLLLALAIYLFLGNSLATLVKNYKFIITIAGFMGVAIVYTTALSISNIGVTETIMISIFAQIAFSKIIDHFGLFGVGVEKLSGYEALAIVLMIISVILLRIK